MFTVEEMRHIIPLVKRMYNLMKKKLIRYEYYVIKLQCETEIVEAFTMIVKEERKGNTNKTHYRQFQGFYTKWILQNVGSSRC